MASQDHSSALPQTRKFTYSIVPNTFQQSFLQTDAKTFDYAASNFGLLPLPSSSPSSSRNDPQSKSKSNPRKSFAALVAHVKHLNASSPPSQSYKLIFLARHGQGVHNVAEDYYTREVWDAKYAKRDGDDIHGRWADAPLTNTGIAQARTAASALQEILSVPPPPPPATATPHQPGQQQDEEGAGLVIDKWYASPLDRCLATAKITWAEQEQVHDRIPFTPLVKESLRECIGVHTCDSRSRTSTLRSRYPDFVFEEGMSECDELWVKDHRETRGEMDERARRFWDWLFSDAGGGGKQSPGVVSITTHSGWIAASLRVLGHRKFRLQTGGILPVVVKAERVE